MTKKIINDIIAPQRTIRQIPISEERKKEIERKAKIHEDDSVEIITPRKIKSPDWKRKSVNPKFAIWFIAIVCLLALFFGISTIFSAATIIVNPKTDKMVFNNDIYIAKSDSQSSADLSFEILNIKKVSSDTVTATEEKDVSKKASGTIVIYNNYSTASQRLINNTRFESTDGRIYRISNSVVVPGLKKSADGKVTPGSIEAIVFADQAGGDYNLKLADLAGDFKIPGFKGDPRYQSFYARLKTDIQGGFIGKQRIVAEDVRKITEASIKEQLNEQLLKELYAVKPENYLIFKDGYSIDYTILADTDIDTNKAKINIEGNLNAVVFNNLKLARYIANKKIANFNDLPVELIISDNLVTTFNVTDKSGLWKNKTIEIKFSGEAILKWVYDNDSLKNDLLGKKESDLENILSKYKDSLVSIRVIFVPVWTRYLPDNPNKIKIQEETKQI
jgi:hypothetical protein